MTHDCYKDYSKVDHRKAVQGRCDCQGQFTVYVWEGAPGRRLKDAYCPHCDAKLARTSCPIGTHPNYRYEDPSFK